MSLIFQDSHQPRSRTLPDAISDRDNGSDDAGDNTETNAASDENLVHLRRISFRTNDDSVIVQHHVEVHEMIFLEDYDQDFGEPAEPELNTRTGSEPLRLGHDEL